ncbi:MAG: hypothetical protein J5794_00075 [Lachnospiraceae bacterium]|nr:hypothetical protein [Lachnospiraceae bacterium]
MKPEIIVPVHLELDHPTTDTIISEILEQYEKYGITTYLLSGPCGGWRHLGYPESEHWEWLAKRFVEVRDALLPYGIRCGWWISITVKSGLLKGAAPVMRADGTTSGFANCPLDPVFRKRLSRDVAAFAKIAKPAFIFTEDDFSVNAAAGSLGCFCEHHLSEFNRRQGTEYTRESLVEALTAGTPEAEALDREWRKLKKDSLVGLAEAMRQALDVDSPEIPMGYMQAASSYKEDNVLYPVSKAMAGDRHTPFARVFGTFYDGAVAREIPKVLYRCLWARQHITEDFTFIHESDTYPHTRFFSSGSAMNAIMASVYSMGFTGSTFQTQQLLDDPNESSDVYGLMLRREWPRFETVVETAAHCRVYGAEIGFDPYYAPPLWTDAVSRMGIPYTSLESSVAFWDVTRARHADREEVLKALSKGLFLDGAAAKALSERGFGEYLGVEVGENAATGRIPYDLAARERIREPFLFGGKGRTMPAAHIFAPGGAGEQLELRVTDEKTEVITDFVTFDERTICPAMTRFENKLGGRIVVLGETVEKNRSQSLFNLRRQRLLQNLILWCGGDFVMALQTPDLFVIENRPVSPDADFKAMLTLTNLCDDTPEICELYLPPVLRGSDVFVMDEAGAWRKADADETERGILLREQVRHYSPVYLLLKR